MKAGKGKRTFQVCRTLYPGVGVSCEEERQDFIESEYNAGCHSVGRRGKWRDLGQREHIFSDKKSKF